MFNLIIAFLLAMGYPDASVTVISNDHHVKLTPISVFQPMAEGDTTGGGDGTGGDPGHIPPR